MLFTFFGHILFVMNNILIVLGVLILLGLIIAGIFGGTYNSLISEKVAVQTAQAQIETQLQRRYDLIPNLVASVKGAQIQEQKVFNDIAQARTHYAGVPSGTPEKIQAANQLESAIGRLLVIVESYPQLQSTQTVSDLMTELEGTENRISVARERYNEAVQTYNQHVQTFPTNVIAGMFGFKTLPLFESTPVAQTAPKVDFGK